jgi:tol-pal system protein YbgF
MMTAALLLGTLVLGGCLTTSTSDDPVANTIYDMHRKVSRLDKELGGTVEHLNETAADLGVRVNESNTQAREVQSMVEENQRKLEQVERKLDSLTRTLYEQFGITMPSGTPSTGWGNSPGQSYVVPGEVQVEPPKVNTPTGSLTPEPDPLAHTDGTVAGTETPVAAEASQLDPVPAYNKAMEAYQRDQFEEALKLFSDFSQRYPDSEIADNAQFWKGECLYNLGRYEECVAEFEKLRTDFPDSAKVPYGMFNQAAAHLKLGQQARAFALLEDLVENYPMTPAAARARSKLKEVQGN